MAFFVSMAMGLSQFRSVASFVTSIATIQLCFASTAVRAYYFACGSRTVRLDL